MSKLPTSLFGSFFTSDEKVRFLLDSYREFELEEIEQEIEDREEGTGEKGFDEYELEDVGLTYDIVSCSLGKELLQRMRATYEGDGDRERNDDNVHGAVVFMRMITTLYKRMDSQLDKTKQSLKKRTLSEYPGEDVTAFAHANMEDLRVLKMGYAMDPGEDILVKVGSTQFPMFNNEVVTMRREVRTLIDKDKLRDPKEVEKDTKWKELSPHAICRKIIKWHSDFLTAWPGVAPGTGVTMAS